MVSNMRTSTSSLLQRLAGLMDDADMQEVARILNVSLATAYRYRKAPSEMSVAAFERLVGHFNLPVSMNLLYREDDVLAAEETRLQFEQEIADVRGWRFVTSPHFTVNCELEEFTREMFSIHYGKKYSDSEAKEYVALRMKRRSLYLSGGYQSEELVNGPSYIDFFYGRGVFSGIGKSLRQRQLEEVVATAALPYVKRRIYSRATPELPVILNYSTRKSVIRVEDLTMIFTDEDCDETNRVLRHYANNADLMSQNTVRSFFLNPLNPQEQDSHD